MTNATSRNYFISPIEKLGKYDCEELYTRTIMKMKKNLVNYKIMNSRFEDEKEIQITKPINISEKTKFLQHYQQPKLYYFLKNPTQKKKEYSTFAPLSSRVAKRNTNDLVKTSNTSLQTSRTIKQVILPYTKTINRPETRINVKLMEKGRGNKDSVTQREERIGKVFNSLNSDKMISPQNKARNLSSKFLSKDNYSFKKRLNDLLMRCDYNLRFNSYHFKELEKKINSGSNIVIKDNFCKEIIDSMNC